MVLPQVEPTITATEYSFDVAGLQAGENRIAFDNVGSEPHQAVLFPILEGNTFEDVEEFFTAEGGPPAGPPPIPFGQGTGTVTIDGGSSYVTEFQLEPGQWALMCFVTDRSGGPPHFTKGMLQEITIE